VTLQPRPNPTTRARSAHDDFADRSSRVTLSCRFLQERRRKQDRCGDLREGEFANQPTLRSTSSGSVPIRRCCRVPMS